MNTSSRRYYPDERWRRRGAVRLPPGALLLILCALGAWASSSGFWLLSALSAGTIVFLQFVPLRHGLTRPARLWLSLALWVALVATRFLLDEPPHTVMWLVGLVADVFALWLALDLSRRMDPPELLLPYSCAVGLVVCAALNPAAPGYLALAAGFMVGGLMETSGTGVRLPATPARAACLAAAMLTWWLLVVGMPGAENWYRQNLGAYLAEAGPVGSTGFGPDSRVGDLLELRLSGRPVLRVVAPGPDRLVGAIHTRYNEGRWDNRNLARRKVLPHTRSQTVPASLEPGPEPVYLLQRSNLGALYRILVASPLDGVMFAPAGVVAVKGDFEDLEADPQGVVYFPPRRTPESYQVLATGRSAGEPGQEDLEVPRHLREPLARLIAGVGPEEPSDPKEVARVLASWLQGRCAYSLRPPPVPPQTDPLLHFLAEGRRGYCEHFAGALTLLLRLRGVPARYVVGFSVTEEVPYGGYYLVRGRDAHAWVEIWTPRGWAMVDPSPPTERATLANRPPMGPLAQRLDLLLSRLEELRAGLSLAGLRRLAARWAEGLALVLAALALWRLARVHRPSLRNRWFRTWRWWTRTARQLHPLEAALASLDHDLAARGRPRPADCTLLDLPRRLELRDGDRQRLEALMQRVCEARFSGGGPSPGEEDLAREVLDFTRRELPGALRKAAG